MDPDPTAEIREEVEKIFAEAVDLPRSERDSFLDGACAGRGELRERVEALLRSNDVAGFLDEPVSPEVEEMLAKLKPEEAGDRIGPYKLLQQIGEGGFGIVWMADQEKPVRRRVALKIIKMGMDTREVIARFEQERQALAMMDHPNIAKVLDAGATKFGRPFFVMELVRGIKITEYCDQANLSTEERLELFIKVCQAVQHAHQKGIIHRDLKPSNILVTLHDGVPVPKVIDFGVAKAMQQQRLTDLTLFTQFEQMIGTPLYMSPEQAEMSGLDIDTRSDIYSLGVLLYELLTGRTPFDPEELMRKGYDEIRRVIRETEPQKPSTFLGTMAAARRSTIAQNRHTESGKLAGLLRGDLDWIVMKALEKDRSRRYETSSDLAQDIRRHLANEPVLAGAPSTFYRVRKFARRNKAGFAVIGIITAILFAATGVSLRQASLAKTAAIEAESARKQATTNAVAERAARQESDATVKFLTEVFQSPDPARDGRTITVAETLDKAVKSLDSGLVGQPGLQASLRMTLGKTYRALGLVKDTIPLMEKVRDHCLRTHGLEHRATIAAMDYLALCYYETGLRQEALALGEQVLLLSRKVNGLEHPATITTMAAVAHTYMAVERTPEARQLQEEVLALSTKVNGPKHPETVRAMNFLSLYYFIMNDKDESLKLREVVVRLYGEIHGPDHNETLWARGSLANSWSDAGRHREALEEREKILAVRLRILGKEHPDTLWIMNHVATSYLQTGREEEALKLLEETFDLRSKVSGPDHPDTLFVMNRVFTLYVRMARIDKERELRAKRLEYSLTSFGADSWRTIGAEIYFSRTYLKEGKYEAGIEMARKVFESSKRIKNLPAGEKFSAAENFADFLLAAGKVDDALEVLVQSSMDCPGGSAYMQRLTALLVWFGREQQHGAICRRLIGVMLAGGSPVDSERVAKSSNLSPALPVELRQGAERLARRAVETAGQSTALPFFKMALGLAEYRNGNFVAAEKWLNEAQNESAASYWDLRDPNRFLIAMNVFRLGRTDEARGLFTEAEAASAYLPVKEVNRFSRPVGHEVLMIWLLHREAKALISGD